MLSVKEVGTPSQQKTLKIECEKCLICNSGQLKYLIVKNDKNNENLVRFIEVLVHKKKHFKLTFLWNYDFIDHHIMATALKQDSLNIYVYTRYYAISHTDLSPIL